MTREPAAKRVAQARGLKSAEDARRLYRDWASDYDHDITDELKFTGSADIARFLASHVDEHSARIIDLGCGTGLAGAEMRRLGFDHIDGLDLSPEMLEVATAKGIYRSVFEADLLQPLDIADGTYDAAISAGTFTTGHVGADRLAEIFRIIRPGGIVACVIACDFWQPGGFSTTLEQLQGDGLIALVHDSIKPISASGDAEAHFCVISVGKDQGRSA